MRSNLQSDKAALRAAQQEREDKEQARIQNSAEIEAASIIVDQMIHRMMSDPSRLIEALMKACDVYLEAHKGKQRAEGFAKHFRNPGINRVLDFKTHLGFQQISPNPLGLILALEGVISDTQSKILGYIINSLDQDFLTGCNPPKNYGNKSHLYNLYRSKRIGIAEDVSSADILLSILTHMKRAPIMQVYFDQRTGVFNSNVKSVGTPTGPSAHPDFIAQIKGTEKKDDSVTKTPDVLKSKQG